MQLITSNVKILLIYTFKLCFTLRSQAVIKAEHSNLQGTDGNEFHWVTTDIRTNTQTHKNITV
jgi:hypothetical protein